MILIIFIFSLLSIGCGIVKGTIFANHNFADRYTSVSFTSSPNTSVLITAFKYTRKDKERAHETSSEFVSRIFGSEALYYNRDHSAAVAKQSITNEEINEAQNRFQKLFSLSPQEQSPACYVTMLGQAFLVTNDEIWYKKHMITKLNNSNAMGISRMSVTGLKWNCYYRDMNKLNDRLALIYYYCPVLEKVQCLDFEDRANGDRVAVELSMPAIALKSKGKFMDINFYAKPFWEGRSVKETSQLAVSTIMPYRSSVPGKGIVQGAILFEWARYHLALGFKVVIYDRNGAHKQDLFKEYNRKYSGGSESGNNVNWDNLIYHNYTILEVIDRTTSVVSHDNTELAHENRRILSDGPDNNGHMNESWRSSKKSMKVNINIVRNVTKRSIDSLRKISPKQSAWEKMELTDLDKVLTLSHSRMELDILYGIGNVLAIDSDEFLYCSGQGLDPKSQYNHILKEVKKGKSAGRASIRFQQGQPVNTTDIYPAECAKDKLSKGKSILSCWGSRDFKVRWFALKTLSLGFHCPVTHFHNAHSLSRMPRSFECGTDPLDDIHNSCELIHLSTAPAFYRTQGGNKYNVTQVRGIKGELFAMTSMY